MSLYSVYFQRCNVKIQNVTYRKYVCAEIEPVAKHLAVETINPPPSL